jgi:DNA (cytosine-5)-methyltransferase 1
MHKKADDIKSNLLLTTLSWVDYLRPKIVYFENVTGFLRFSFNVVQAGKHKVEGGIHMGGMKFIVRAMIDMGYYLPYHYCDHELTLLFSRYQVRFGLLQAGNYGTPQGRIRLIIIAAVDGHPLPELPQPSHDFPSIIKKLEIKHPTEEENSICPVWATRGTAPHAFVTIDDAISDLPRFDW